MLSLRRKSVRQVKLGRRIFSEREDLINCRFLFYCFYLTQNIKYKYCKTSSVYQKLKWGFNRDKSLLECFVLLLEQKYKVDNVTIGKGALNLAAKFSYEVFWIIFV